MFTDARPTFCSKRLGYGQLLEFAQRCHVKPIAKSTQVVGFWTRFILSLLLVKYDDEWVVATNETHDRIPCRNFFGSYCEYKTQCCFFKVHMYCVRKNEETIDKKNHSARGNLLK